MSRRIEKMLKGLSSLIAFILLCGAVCLFAVAFWSRPDSRKASIDSDNSGESGKTPKPQARDPKIAQLADSKMTRTVVPKLDIPVKPLAPELATLIQVKGIFEYGNPKTNEALIEIVKSNQTKSYKAGDAVEGVGAVLVEVDKIVTFTYDGKTVKLGIKSERAELAPLASPDAPVPVAERPRN